MLKFNNVTKSFQDDFWKKPKKVVNNLSFEVGSGSLCGFLGANGAGKTTSIKATLDFIKIDSGEISFSPELGQSPMEIRSKIGYFPEGPYFYPHMTGRQFILYLGQLQKISRKEIQERMNSWGERLSIAFAFDKKIRGYSKGMLQRLGFLSCLIHEPRFIILDEPLSGLDPLGRKEFKDILLELNNKGVTIFFSSHIVSDVEEICDSLVVIKTGELFYSGSTDSLLSSQTSKTFRVAFNIKEQASLKLEYYKPLKTRGSYNLGIIPRDKKDHFLSALSDCGGDLQELVVERMTLEEIIYQSTEGGHAL